MAELNFNALASPGPKGFYQGFEQGREKQVTSEINQMKLEELKRDRDEMLQLQEKLKGLGQDPDVSKFLDTLAQTGKPEYVKMAIEGKQKIKDLDAYAKLGAIEPVTAAPAMPTGAPALGAPALRMPQAFAPTNMLGSGTFGMGMEAPAVAPVNAMAPAPAAPVNALAPRPGADLIAPTQQRIKQLLDFARTNPRMAAQAMSEARILQDQLELYSKRAPAESADVQTMRALGIPVTPEGYQTFTGAKRAERLLTPAEEAQQLRLRLASRPPGVSITNVGEKAESAEFGKLLIGQFDAISKQASVAARTLPSIEANLATLNKGLDTGFGTDAKAAGARVLGALGVKDADKFATDTQMFQSNAISAVLQKQLEQKGPQTESDARRIEQIGAELGKTKDANRFILDLAREQLRRDLDQRNFYTEWKKGPGKGSFNGAEDAWFAGEGGKSLFDRPALKKYAVGAASPAAQIPTAATPPRAVAPAPAPSVNIDALLNKYKVK
jgi:hypothetical protein